LFLPCPTVYKGLGDLGDPDLSGLEGPSFTFIIVVPIPEGIKIKVIFREIIITGSVTVCNRSPARPCTNMKTQRNLCLRQI